MSLIRDLMKSIRFWFILVALGLIPGIAFGAKEEFRGVWVHNWRPGILSESQVQQTVQWAKDCNMNALVVQVRRIGDAYYQSAYEPRANNIEAGPDFDPLGYVIKRAHPAGLEVYAWFNSYRVGAPTGIPQLPGHVGLVHPEWLSKDVNGVTCSADGEFLDPGAPGVREYLVKVAGDIVRKYAIDGLMLDFIRYPGKNWGYNDSAVAAFNARYMRKGKPSPDDPLWCDWRRRQVTETVRAIYKEAHNLKPRIKVSAATIAWGSCPDDFTQSAAYRTVFQDWKSWMRDKLLDANMPMNYRNPSLAQKSRAFSDWVCAAKRWSYGRSVYCGLMLYKDVAGTVRQIQLARDKGADGVVGLSFSQDSRQDTLACLLKSGVFTAPAPLLRD